MKRVIKDENGVYQIVSNSRIKIVHPLSCGNVLVVWFEKHRVKGKKGSLWEGMKACWNVSIYVGKLKDANKWKRKPHALITGNGSLEALKYASKYIIAFARDWIGYGEELQICGLDKRRYRSYKFLCRYEGFEENDKNMIIHYRNPIFYEWSEE